MYIGHYTHYNIRIKRDKCKQNLILDFQIVMLYSIVPGFVDGTVWFDFI
jgi:hypothetical protein